MVVRENEVSLNSIRYPTMGQIMPQLASAFAEKQVIGDYTKDSDPSSSAWVISDQTGGMLVENLEESANAKRYWWSTADTRYNSEITLPPLATVVSAPTITTPTIVNADMELDSDWTDDGNGKTSRSNTESHGSTYSWKVNLQVNGTYYAYQDLASYDKGGTYTFKCWVKVPVVSDTPSAYIAINDGLTTTNSSSKTEGVTWLQLSVTKTISTAATKLQLRLYGTISDYSTGNPAAYLDDVTITADSTVGNPTHAIDFNNEVYWAYGGVLAKLNAGGTAYVLVNILPAEITALIENGTNLFILCGDATSYFYMTTGDVLAQTDEGDATFGIWWDSKLFVFDSAGACKYDAAPAVASPGFTANGALPILDGELQGLILYQDADGNDIILCSTKRGFYAHDFANAIFLETTALIPPTATAGLGSANWHSSAYISSGLSVTKYTVFGNATVETMGLDKDDGVPNLRGGAIVKLYKGLNEMYALVDPTYESANDTGYVARWNDTGWDILWQAAAANKNMYTCLTSDTVSYRFWFSTTDGVYYIPLLVSAQKPKRTTSYTYGADAEHITGWFDADWLVGNKNALRLIVGVDDITSTETITVKYRLNHATIAIATAWTTLLNTTYTDGIIDTDVNEVTFDFGSSLGTNFKAIQFRFDFAQAGASTTSPILRYATLTYEKVLPKRWAWQFTVDCTQPYNNVPADTLLNNIITAAELETLVPFLYDETTYYVRILAVQGKRLTGNGKQGEYEVTVQEIV